MELVDTINKSKADIVKYQFINYQFFLFIANKDDEQFGISDIFADHVNY